MSVLELLEAELELVETLLEEPLKTYSVRSWIRKAIATILYIQYVNALRISEAVECAYKYLQSGEREIPVVNRKARNIRLCVIPRLTLDMVKALRFYFHRHGYDLDRVKRNVRRAAGVTYKIRTHDMRRLSILRMYRDYNMGLYDIVNVTRHKWPRTITKYYIAPLLNEIYGETGGGRG